MERDLKILGDPFHAFVVNRNYQVVNVQCFCGKIWTARWHGIKTGTTKSCGCQRYRNDSETNKRFGGGRHNRGRLTHGLKGHKLYGVWKSMLDRCYNTECKAYRYYGGRGIRVCKEWKKDVLVFYAWAIANGWKEGLHMDRINNYRGYGPNNCRFVSPKENMRNKRKPVLVSFKGDKKPLAEWAEIVGISYSLLYRRLFVDKLPPDDVLSGKKFPRKERLRIPIDSAFAAALKKCLIEEGRSQRWLVNKMKDRGISIDDSQISEKINCIYGFREKEKKAIQSILKKKF